MTDYGQAHTAMTPLQAALSMVRDRGSDRRMCESHQADQLHRVDDVGASIPGLLEELMDAQLPP